MEFIINQVRINLNEGNSADVTLLASSDGATTDKPSNGNGFAMVMPLKLAFHEKESWTVPVEPLVSISGGNVIAKRTVSKGKGRGTIKERWTQDDYQVTIEGVLINLKDANVYPEEDVRKLREFCEATEALDVECDLLKIYDITRITIVSWDIPFTKGEANQRFTISALSDDLFDLLKEDVKPLAYREDGFVC